MLGLPDIFVEHGDPAALLAAAGLDADGIAGAILRRFPDQQERRVANDG